MATLSAGQQRAIEEALKGRNVFITGGGGVGKSYVVGEIVRRLREEQGKNVMTTGSTGIAACNVSGSTLHSFAGFRIGPEEFSPKSIRRKSMNPTICSKWETTDVLVIDETSMVDPEFFEAVSKLACICRDEPDHPFGGVQVLVVADFFQLPPVNDRVEDYVFMSPTWRACNFVVVELTENFRQASDPVYAALLGRVRKGAPTQADINLLRSRINADVSKKLPDGSVIHPMNVRMTNRDVDLLNAQALNRIDAASMVYKVVTQFCYPSTQRTGNKSKKPNRLPAKTEQDMLESALRTTQVPRLVTLKTGVQVRLCHNRDLTLGLVNGSQGVVVGFQQASDNDEDATEWPLVRFQTVEEPVLVTRHDFKVPLDNGCTGLLRQVPLVLAFSSTVHKCVDAETLVPTSKGLKTIKQLSVPGQADNSWHVLDEPIEIYGRSGLNLATQVYKGEVEDAIVLTTSKGFRIKCSFRHPLLVCKTDGSKDWVKAPDIKVRDVLCMKRFTANHCASDISTVPFTTTYRLSSRSTRAVIPETVTPDLCYFFGVVIGDGCLTDQKDARVEWVSHSSQSEILDRTDLILQKVVKSVSRDTSRTNIQRSMFFSRHFRDFMSWCGIGYDKSSAKKVPWVVLQGSVQSQKAFIRGMFDTDGGVNNSSVHFTTTSDNLATNIQTMLFSLGIVGTRSILHKAGSIGNCSEAYRLTISGADARQFCREIGFYCISKQEKLVKLFGGPERSRNCAVLTTIPHGKQLMLQLHKELVNDPLYGSQKYAGHNLKNILPIVGKFISIIKTGVGNLHMTQVEWLKNNIHDLHRFPCGQTLLQMIDQGDYFDTVHSIVVGKGHMYDLFVPDTHEFVSNGIISHNCQGMTLDSIEAELPAHASRRPGMAYTALSRVKRLDGLSLLPSFSADSLVASPAVLAYYNTATATKADDPDRT